MKTRCRGAALAACLLLAVVAADATVADDVDLDLKALAKCVDASGARLYVAHWCPYCREQLAIFGKYASLLPTVECYDGPKRDGMNRTCRRAKIESFPTWHYPDGRVVKGVQVPGAVAVATGCHPFQSRDGEDT